MRRRLHVRLLLWTLVGVAVCALVVHGVHALQVYRNAGAILLQADRAIERKQYPQAQTFLIHYLTYEPRDVDALAKLADLQEKLARTKPEKVRALLALEQVLRRSPERRDVRQRAIALAQHLSRHDDAVRHLEVLIAAAPTDAALEHQLAECHEAAGEPARAAAALRRAIVKDPARVTSYARLADLLLYRLDQGDSVLPLLNDLVSKNPSLAAAWLLRARHFSGLGETERADRDLDEALRLGPRDPDVLLAAAERARSKGQWDRAREFLAQGLAARPERVALYKALAALEVRQGRQAAARACLRRGLERVPTSIELRYYLADLLIDAGEVADAEREWATLREQRGAGLEVEFLRARLLQGRRAWSEAAALLEGMRGRLGALPEWLGQLELCLGRCYEELGEMDLELAAYRRALDKLPLSAVARFGLACAQLRAGGVHEALAELEQLSRGSETPPEVWTWWARALVVQNGRQPEKQRDWAEVERLLRQAEVATPGAALVPVVYAEMHLARQQPALAEAVLQRARKERPGAGLLWAALVDLAGQQGQWAAARLTLAEARQEVGDTVMLRLAEVRLGARMTPAQGVKLLAALAGQPRQPLTRAEQARWLHEVARALYRLGGRTEAVRVWRQLAAEQAHELGSRLILFDLAIQAGDGKTAAALAAEVRRIEGPGGVLWRACEAEVLITQSPRGDRAALAKAQRLLDEATAAQRGWSRLVRLFGALAERVGDMPRALEHYLRALQAGERQAGLAARVARLLYDRQQYAEAERALGWVEAVVLAREPALRELAVRIRLRTPDSPKVLTLDTRDYRDHLWLAEVLRSAGEGAKAVTVLRQAAQLSPNIPDVWVALVRQLDELPDRAAAEQALTESQQKLPPGRRALALARGYAALGEVDRADKVYLDLLRAQPDDTLLLEELAAFYRQQQRWNRAEEILRRLLAPETGAAEEVLAEARRQLALVLAARGVEKR